MRLNHLDLQVHDVQATALFFERHFGFLLQSSRTSPALAILAGEGGFTLVLQRRKDEVPYPEGFHVGFLRDTPDEVERFHAGAVADGLDVSPLLRNARGTLVYLRHDGVLLEVSCHARRFAPGEG